MITRVLLISVIVITAFALGCGDDGCKCSLYNHIYHTSLPLHCDYDTIYLFFADSEYYRAPISYSTYPASEMVDSFIVVINAYGQTPVKDMKPNIDRLWQGDSLAIWYSYQWSQIDSFFYEPSAGATKNSIDRCSCPTGEPVRIDYIEIRHAPGMTFIVDPYVKYSLY